MKDSNARGVLVAVPAEFFGEHINRNLSFGSKADLHAVLQFKEEDSDSRAVNTHRVYCEIIRVNFTGSRPPKHFLCYAHVDESVVVRDLHGRQCFTQKVDSPGGPSLEHLGIQRNRIRTRIDQMGHNPVRLRVHSGIPE